MEPDAVVQSTHTHGVDLIRKCEVAMGSLFETVRKFFQDNEWYFLQLDSRPMLQMSHNGQSGKWLCYASVMEEQFLFFFYSVCPINIPEEKRSVISEYITRANYGLKIGNFELDYSDGEVRYKTSIDVENHQISPALMSNLVQANLWTMDRYLPGIFLVVYGEVQPADAVYRIENPGN
jgi:hypothetical protein